MYICMCQEVHIPLLGDIYDPWTACDHMLHVQTYAGPDAREGSMQRLFDGRSFSYKQDYL